MNQTASADVTLVVGNQSEVIDATGAAPLVNKDTLPVGQFACGHQCRRYESVVVHEGWESCDR
jgi:hypothetical protein